MSSSLLFEVENGLELPGTFTFERRASLGAADKVLNFAERDRQGKKTFSGGRDLSRRLQGRQGWGLEGGSGRRTMDSVGRVNSKKRQSI